MSHCRVSISATLEQHAVHVESGQPSSLVFVVEGEGRAAPAMRRAWNDYVSTHPADSVGLAIPLAVPPGRRLEVANAILWLVRKICLDKEAHDHHRSHAGGHRGI